MQTANTFRRVLGTLLAVTGLMAGTVAGSGEKVGTNIDSRVLIGFQVSDASVQPWLPEDWKLLTLPKGPLAGTNLIVGFFDRKLQLDGEGKPAAQPATLGAELVAFAVKPGEEGSRLYVLRKYEPAPFANTYGATKEAFVERTSTVEGGAPGRKHESWQITTDSGALSLDLAFAAGKVNWVPGKNAPVSASDASISRMQEYNQMMDLVMSSAVGKPLDGDFSFSTSIPELAAMFDGSEKLTGILSIPVYVRDVYMP